VGAENPSVFDPFSLLGLEKTYFLEARDLEKAYFEAQKKTHPDQFAQASLEIRQEASRQSTAVNQAYLSLKNPLARAEYLVGGKQESLPDPDFLEKIMVWKEQKEAGTLDLEEVKVTERHLFQEIEQAFRDNKLETVRMALPELRYVTSVL
jgi:molecular chaperone HscB